MVGTANNSLAFLGNRSDESSCANQAQKGFTIMANAEAIITENAATVAEQGAHIAPEKASSKKGVSQKKGASKSQKSAKDSKTKALPKKEARPGRKAPKPALAKDTCAPRAESKGAKILELIGRPRGATLAEILTATDWQKHSIRASSLPPPSSTASRSSPRRPKGAIAYTRSNRHSGSSHQLRG
jgi:hypothetical protein